MAQTKLVVFTNYRKLKRKCQLSIIEYDVLKNHKLALYKHRKNYIKSLKITENMARYLKFKDKGVNFTKHFEQKIEKRCEDIKNVS